MLEDRDLVGLPPDPQDLRAASAATEQAERRFLAPLPDAEAAAFTEALRAVAFPDPGEQRPGP